MVALLCEKKFEKFKIIRSFRKHFYYAYIHSLQYVAAGISPPTYSSGVIAILLSKKCKSSPFRGFRAIDSKKSVNLKNWRNYRRNLFETMPIVFPGLLSTIIEVFGKKKKIKFFFFFPWVIAHGKNFF